MKRILLLISIFCFILVRPAISGQGDVYYCTSDSWIIYNQEKKRGSISPETLKFKFKWAKSFDGDAIQFDDDFLIGNYKMGNVHVVNDEIFMATRLEMEDFPSDFLSFDEPRFQFSFFAGNPEFKSTTLFATCSKF